MGSQWRWLMLCLLGLLSLQVANAAPTWADLLKGNNQGSSNQQGSSQQAAPVQVAQAPIAPSSPPRPSTPEPAEPPRPGPGSNIPRMRPESRAGEVPKSYSASGRTYADVVKSSEHGFLDMTRQHGNKGNKPGIVSALKTPDGKTYLDSSRKGGAPASKNVYPGHLKQPQTKEIYDACKKAHGGGHGSGGNCGELRNADKFFKANKDKDHIPPASQWAAHGHFGKDTTKHQSVPACRGGGTHAWGCEQFKEMAKTPKADRPAKIDEYRKNRGKAPLTPEQKPASNPPSRSPSRSPSPARSSGSSAGKRKPDERPDPPAPNTPDAEGWLTAGKKGKKKGRRSIEEPLDKELLEVLSRRALLYLI